MRFLKCLPRRLPLTVEDAAWLVDRLYRDAHNETVALGLELKGAIDQDVFALALSLGSGTRSSGC